MKIRFRLPLLLVALLTLVASAQAAVPKRINYQGYLTNTAGVPLTGTYPMVFALCDAATAGTCPWTESQSVAVDKGIFNVTLGSATPLSLVFDIPYFLDIQVNGEQMSARQPLTSVGYAFMADTASQATNAATAASVTGTVPAAQVSGLSTVATTGAYSDLSGNPVPGTDFLAPNGNGSALIGLTKSQVGLNNVENTALSTWAGSSNITTLGTITTGTVPVARVSGLATVATSGDAGDLSGTLSSLSFPATLPAASGVNLTSLNATNLGSGTIPDARFPATLPAVSGANLTSLNASNLASGTVPAARMPALTGDISSSAGSTAMTVTRLQGVTVASVAPTSGQVLAYNGVAWSPATAAGGADTTPPVPGGSGTITATNSGVDIALSWTAATDTATPQANLEYTVFYSATNNIGTVANAEANGTLVGLPWSSNITTKTVKGLTVGTTYYFNVAVKDAGLNKVMYTTVSKVPSVPTTNVVLYSQGTAFTGDLGGRSGANTKCSVSPNKPAGFSNFAAFLSVDASDTIAGRQAFPGLDTALNIRSPNGTLIANNWADLMDGSIITSLTAAGLTIPTGYWNSGSTSNGSLRYACNGWTTGTNGTGALDDWGVANASDYTWITPATSTSSWDFCGELTGILCIAW